MTETVGSSKENQEWLMREVDSINKMLSGGFHMPKDVKELYRDKLGDYRKDYIAHVLSDICKWKVTKMPTVGIVMEEYAKLNKRLNPRMIGGEKVNEDEVTAERNLKKTAIEFMYLYYKHGYTYVADSVFIRQIYIKLFGDEPFDFDKLQGRITRDMVMKYVEDGKTRQQASQ